ncbi:hypothetical protein DFQ28_007105 [Apophysomyces sp. BC1034]|nr:hypothetical protein DFQ30_007848 [Apophysomyces sp. BC1015]KAG0181926.1 hypothetical protein DFQ29_006458 [Apophysomyces sp. BC1021]KAG0192919.1 hypothetical protein DFQ28_007105 [Apophysomyces sp. BC1034]
MNCTKPTPDLQLKDNVTGEVICAEEWIARELQRIDTKDQRQCRDYESLIEVIEELNRIQHAPTPITLQSEDSSPQRLDQLAQRLVRAFVELFKYARLHHHQPAKLLNEFEMIKDTEIGGLDLASMQQRLFSIIFGKIQMTKGLVQTWRIICDWARHLQYTRDRKGWMLIGVNAYNTARRHVETSSTDDPVFCSLETQLKNTHIE